MKVVVSREFKNDEDIENYLKIRAKAYGENVFSKVWLDVKYFGSPFGRPFISRAIENDSTVGAVVYLPHKFNLHLVTPIKGAIIIDTFISKDYRGKGIFDLLIKAVLQELAKAGIMNLVNFPNANAIKGLRRNGFHISENLLFTYVYPIRKLRLLQYVRNFKSLFVPLNGNGFFQFHCESISTEKLEYIRWRADRVHNRSYYLIGNCDEFVFLRLGTRGNLVVADVLISNISLMRTAALIRRYISIDIHLITLTTSKRKRRLSQSYGIRINSKVQLLYSSVTSDFSGVEFMAIDFHTY